MSGRQEQPDLVDLAGVEERPGEVRAALEQDRGDAGGAELVQRRDDARGLVLAGGHDHVDAVGLQRVGGGARRGARDDDGQRDLAGVAHQLGVERQAAQRVEHDPPRLAGRRPGIRAVSSGSSASAVPMPTATASHSARQWWARSRLDSPGDPLGVAAVGGDLAVERHRRLEQDPGPAGAGALAKGLVEQPRAVGQIAVGEHHLDAVVAQDPQAAAGGVLGRVVGGDHHAQDPGLADRVGARRRAAVVAAGLQRHVQRGVGQVVSAGGANRLDLGVGRAERAVKALADRPVAVGDHRPDQRVGADPAAALLGELDRASQVAAIGIGDGRHLRFGA